MHSTFGRTSKSRKLLTVAMILSVSGTLTACVTNSSKTSASNPAPISYKAGKIDMAKRAEAAARPSSMPYVAAPNSLNYAKPNYKPSQISTPKPMPVTRPAPQIAAQSFDQSGVDTDLYMHQRVGKPYTIDGKRYTPEHDPSYDDTGIASWYGPNFDGKLTANGETYDKDGLSAAHKTLPLNSDVFVTNLENGKTLKLRINDRGPFVDGRIIDLSQGAAKELGVKGLARVRVQYAGPTDPNLVKRSQSAELSMPTAPIAPQIQTPKAQPLLPQVAEVPGYKPLSVVPFASPDTVSLPQAAPIRPAPMVSVPAMPAPPLTPRDVDVPPQAPGLTRIAPLAPQITTPSRGRQDFTPPADGGVMTLTIKGPIHMASAEDDQFGHVIPALYEGEALTPSITAQNVHYVQAATFSTLARASSVKTSLSTAGHVTIHDVNSNGQHLHRVLVGPYKSEADATLALSSVVTLGFADARVTEVY